MTIYLKNYSSHRSANWMRDYDFSFVMPQLRLCSLDLKSLLLTRIKQSFRWLHISSPLRIPWQIIQQWGSHHRSSLTTITLFLEAKHWSSAFASLKSHHPQWNQENLYNKQSSQSFSSILIFLSPPYFSMTIKRVTCGWPLLKGDAWVSCTW